LASGDFNLPIGNPSILNFGSFDALPLVEFIPDPSIAPNRVKELLRMDPPTAGGGGAHGGGWN